MAIVVFDSSSLTLKLKHVERKADGSFQYRRRIPKPLQKHNSEKTFFVRSLGRSVDKIQGLSVGLTEKLDRDWSALQGFGSPDLEMSIPVVFKMEPLHALCGRVLPTRIALNLTSSLSLYLGLHPKGRQKEFRDDNERVMKAVIERIGDLDLASINRSHAEDYRDHALKSQSTSTVRRNLHALTAIVNKARKEKQLQILNPFEGLGIVGEGEDGAKRIPFDGAELQIISRACHNLDDDIRHIIAFQLDTGCRVAEIVGLRVEDVILTHTVAHIRIKPWGKVRTLKTAASERDIPLVGDALWAARRSLETRRKAKEPGLWLFPRYASDKEIKATHASNALNKWLRSLEAVQGGKTTHCFRHAMRDRLRAAQVPHDIQDAIGGWGTRTIGQGYGSGYPLNVLAEHMCKVV